METLQRPGLRADFSPRREAVGPPAPEAVVTIARTGRGRVARLDVTRGIDQRRIDAGITDDAEIVAPRDGGTAEVRSRVPRVVARPILAGSDDRLREDDARRREGIAATRGELLMRVSKRVSLPQAEAARGLCGAVRRDGMTASVGPGARRPHDPVLQLAAMVLGVREREVFLARREARQDDVTALHALAACLGISAERVYELEASARRKLTRALG